MFFTLQHGFGEPSKGQIDTIRPNTTDLRIVRSSSPRISD
jgi:hypothetical protein